MNFAAIFVLALEPNPELCVVAYCWCSLLKMCHKACLGGLVPDPSPVQACAELGLVGGWLPTV